MPGGPISGAPVFGAADAFAATVGFNADITDSDFDVRGVIVPTLLQITADAISYWTGMTCLYNRYWYPLSDAVTMPIAMFHVKKMTETQQNEISKKRVMLYEPQKAEAGGQLHAVLREGVMQTVVDNIVKQPKTYTVEAIVPYQPVGRYVADGVRVMNDMLVSFVNLLGGENQYVKGFSDWLAASFAVPAALVKGAEQATGIASMFGSSGVDGATMINKSSLEAMADSGKVLCMKMWTGYDYKFVSITNLSFDKDPREDDVFRATIQMQEMPVLQVTPPKDIAADSMTRGWRAEALSAVMGLLAEPLMTITDVAYHAGGRPVDMLQTKW
jgi:hypothetical protein